MTAAEMYGASLRDAALPLTLREEDGTAGPVPVRTYLGALTAADHDVIARATGPVLDVGCGPGRHVVALARRGVAALGIDASPVAVQVAADRGAPVVRACVFGRVPHAGRWGSALLLDGSLFMLFSGLSNTARWYPWEFSFVPTHFWTAWITIGALVAHIGAKIHISRRALSPAARHAPEPEGTGLSRRGLFTATAAAVGVVTLTTVGQTLRPLKDLALLAPRRPDVGPQGFPVNKSAVGARVTAPIADPAFTLTIDGAVPRELSFGLDELRAMPQHRADLAITCVEGWSAGARWEGVRVRDLLALAGASPDAEVVVHSVQARGAYRSSELNVPHARHPDTLLALRSTARRCTPTTATRSA